MSPVPCSYCALPVRVSRVEPGRPVFCCVGCAIASRVPVDERGDYPITSGLLFASALAFLVFNQWLGWLLALALRLSARPEHVPVVFWASLSVGLVIWLAVVIAGVVARTQRGLDVWLAGAALVGGGASVVLASAVPFAVTNTLLVLWHARGFLRRRGAQANSGLRV